MVELDYGSPWYQTLPEWHIVIGMVLILVWSVMLFRLFFIRKAVFPDSIKRSERILASLVKLLFYVLVSTLLITGYLITTASGQSTELFGWLKIPAVSRFSASQIDTMGWLHQYASYVLMVLVIIHVLGALKHHFIDRDETLKRMT